MFAYCADCKSPLQSKHSAGGTVLHVRPCDVCMKAYHEDMKETVRDDAYEAGRATAADDLGRVVGAWAKRKLGIAD